MAKPRIILTTPYDSPGTLVFRCQKSLRNSNDITPNGGAKFLVMAVVASELLAFAKFAFNQFPKNEICSTLASFYHDGELLAAKNELCRVVNAVASPPDGWARLQWRAGGEKGGQRGHPPRAAFGGAKIWNYEIWSLLANCIADICIANSDILHLDIP